MKKIQMLSLLTYILFATLVIGCVPPLHTAASRGDIATVRELIEQGADVNEMNYITPLHYAVIHDFREIAELLIAKGANVNAKAAPEYRGETPLMFAAEYGKKSSVELLLAKGADPLMRNTHGKTARLFAAENGHHDVEQLLKEAEVTGPRRVEDAEADPREEALFLKSVQEYRTAVTRPTLPEEARRYKVQAEFAVKEKQFYKAAELYGKALNIAPWWPEGHFNRAIVLSESKYPLEAIREMKRYLTLEPNAPDARAAQDKIYQWELKAGK